MHKIFGITAFLVFAAASWGQDRFVDTARIYNAENYKNKFVPGEFIVAFKSGLTDFANPSLSGAARVRSRRNLAMAKRPRDHQRVFTERNLILMVSDDTTRAGLLANLKRIRQDPNVDYVEPNYILHSNTVPNDPSFSLQWNMQNLGQTGGTPHADIDATQAWNTTQGNRNFLIGVIDTGIDYLHPDLAANMWTNPGEIPNNGIDDDGDGFIDDVHGFNFVNNTGDPMDDNGHGTHVSGIIAAAGNNGVGVTGVVWNASLVAIKFLDSTGSGTEAAAIDAINYANALGIPITNNSWGGGSYTQSMKDVIDAAGDKGYLFVAAGGNSATNNDSTPFYPASYTSSNLISVAATDDNDALASFSNYGQNSVDLGAPGVSIYSTYFGNTYQYLSGTSMASPHVAGAAALLWSYNPKLTSAQVKGYLLQGVDSVASLKGRVVSGGRLNVNKALGLASPPSIAYKNTALSAIKNVAIPQDTAISIGGTITGFAMSVFTPLPAGLSINGTTGVIFGTPTAITSTTTDTVIATGPNGTGTSVLTITVADTAPAISYKRASISAIRNVAITPDTAVSIGGGITGYAMSTSTPLPAGLTLNSGTGILSGTPSAVTATVIDTIIAAGAGGSGKAAVSIAVADTAPAISYKHLSIAAVRNTAVTPDTVVSTGGAIASYAMSPSTPLPAGLALNTTTGILSGIPTIVTAAVNDTVIATGAGGTGKTTVNIAVADTNPAISYKHATIAAIRNIPIIPDTVTPAGGAITSYAASASTPLPSGLILNTATGTLSGTPTAVTAAVNDTVIATGPGGTGRTAVNVTVADTAPAITYKRISIAAIRNVALVPDTAVSTGGAVVSYAMSPSTPLPAGLSLSSIMGVISGTPAIVVAAANDTVIATGPGGTGKAVVNIAVMDTAPAISYARSTISLVKNTAFPPDTAISRGGAVTSYAMAASAPLPTGLSLSASTGIISGIPAAITATANDTVIATGPGGTGKTFLTITVADTAPAISYKLASITAVKSVAIVPDTALSTGGAISTFALSPSTPLPAGLSLNSTTGIISGVPTAAATTSDTILATGPGGTGKTVVNIMVNSVVAILDPYVVHLPGSNAFSFRVPEGSTSVRLLVQDIRGKMVLSREQSVGKNNLVSWDGRGSNGRAVPAGIYVVHLKLQDAAHNSSEVQQTGALVP